VTQVQRPRPDPRAGQTGLEAAARLGQCLVGCPCSRGTSPIRSTRNPPIPQALAVAHTRNNSDILRLTEYVADRTGAVAFRHQLRDAGYIHQAVTTGPPRHNRVLAASRLPFERGDITTQTTDGQNDEFSQSNFLRLKMLDSPIELIGVRAPWWNVKINPRYRRELRDILCKAASDRALVVAGDLNEDPFKGVRRSMVGTRPAGFTVSCPFWRVRRVW
jgi:hypothetical protein